MINIVLTAKAAESPANSRNYDNSTIINTLLRIRIGESNATLLQEVSNKTSSQERVGNRLITTYQSSDPSKPHIVYEENGVVTFAQIVLDGSKDFTKEKVVSQHGEPVMKMYSTHSTESLVYAYPSIGTTYHIEESSGYVFLIQKTEPMSKEKYNESFGKDFTSAPIGDNFDEVKQITGMLTNPVGTDQTDTIFMKSVNSIYYLYIAFICIVIIGISYLIKKIRSRKLHYR